MAEMSQAQGAATSVEPMGILFATSEAQPLIKTGGLADVAGALPAALRQLGQDARLALPAYPQAMERSGLLRLRMSMELPGIDMPVRIFEAQLPSHTPVYLVDAPQFFARPGNPYTSHDGRDWPDNPERFTLFCRAVVELAMDRAGLGWRPEIVHCNDWQTGLVAPLLSLERDHPASVFTIHNLAYQGIFDRATFDRLGLPSRLWSSRGVEFHRKLSFIKGGLAFSDLLNTVSPTYAEEIRTPEFGYGLEGLLNHIGDRLVGVLNGADYDHWNPAADPSIGVNFDAARFEAKGANKVLLQEEMGLPVDRDTQLFGHIGRLVQQKGVDLILDVLPGIMDHPDTQVILLGSGDPELERKLRSAAERFPGRVAIHLGQDERLAHRIEAGCDCFLMPSRFEPCGLNQLYSLRYGTLPVVRRTGGLADTVVDASTRNIENGTATGFVFQEATAAGLWSAVERALALWQRSPETWKQVAVNGMGQDFSWSASSKRYLDLYHKAMAHPVANPLVA